MNKKKLLQLRTLRPTDKMMQMAKNDTPQLIHSRWDKKRVDEKYKHPVFMRLQILQGIMKVAIFLTESMRLDNTSPYYELFIDFKNDQFITYDCRHQKWHTAMLENLDMPFNRYLYGYSYSDFPCYINPEGSHSIKTYLKVKKGGWAGIMEYQQRVRQLNLEAADKRITDVWDEDLSQIPKLPKDWDDWIRRVGITDHIIMYHYDKKGATEGYCSRCGKVVPIKHPKHNEKTVCECCHKPATFKSVNKMSQYCRSKLEIAHLLQKCKDGFVIRSFLISIYIEKGKYKYPLATYPNVEYIAREKRRVIFNNQLDNSRAYNYEWFKNRSLRWCKGTVAKDNWYHEKGKVYGKSLNAIEALKYTGLIEMIRNSVKQDPEVYIAEYRKTNCIERIAKAQLYRLCDDIVYDRHYSYWDDDALYNRLKNSKPNIELHKLLGIDKNLMKKLRQVNGGLEHLEWYQYAKKRNKIIPDDAICWFVDNHIDVSDISFITDRMKEHQIARYLKKQVKICGNRERATDLITTWQDYLEMAKRLKMNVAYEIIYKPRYLLKKHDELVQKIGSVDAAREANEILAKYPDVDDICSTLSAKYEYQGEKYSVLTPRRIEDVLNDSNELSHCVSRSPNRYFERIQTRESYILFLRKTEYPDKPFYTLEVEPNGTVRQTRTKHNTQGKDITEIKEFLVKWQKEISKRLSDEDISLGEKSNLLRLEEYGELREKKATIQGGTYRGKLLADVLESDLLLNRQEVCC